MKRRSPRETRQLRKERREKAASKEVRVVRPAKPAPVLKKRRLVDRVEQKRPTRPNYTEVQRVARAEVAEAAGMPALRFGRGVAVKPQVLQTTPESEARKRKRVSKISQGSALSIKKERRCKKRPVSNKSAAGSGKRGFVPWCK